MLCLAASLGLTPCSVLAASPSSPWSVRLWQTDDGLPNNEVFGLAQTADGYLWIATPSRLVRFDGVTFEDVRTQDFASNFTQRSTALLATPEGLWLGFNHGSVAFLHDSAVRLLTTGLPDRMPQTLLRDRKGTVWISYRAGVLVSITGSEPQTYTPADGFPPGYLCSVATDTAGDVWYGKNGRIGVFRDGAFVEQLKLPREPTGIAAAREGGLWICVGAQLYRYHGRQLTPLATIPGASPIRPSALLEDRTGGVWIGTWESGVWHYSGSELDLVMASHVAITALLEDREGSVWVGTNGAGLSRVRRRSITLQNTATGLPFDTARSLTEDTHGGLWAVTDTEQLFHQNDGRWENATGRADWPGGHPSVVAADASGGVWIVTREQMIHHWTNGHFVTWRQADGVVGHTAHTLVAARNGDVWVGEESPDIVQRIRAGQIKTFKLPSGIRMIRAMAEDSTGDVWLGTTKGYLFRIHDEKVIDETARIMGRDGFRSVRYLEARPDGKLWIAYADEGLGLYQNGRFTNLTTAQGLPDNNLSQIVPDGHGWLWIGGDHGIFKARESDLAAVAAGRASMVQVNRYSQNEGLGSLQALTNETPCAVQLRDGRIWMPLRTAIAAIDPREQTPPVPAPLVRLKRFLVNDSPVKAAGEVAALSPLAANPPATGLLVAADHRRIEIEYTALSHAAPESVQFQYRLQGFDDGWVDAGVQRSVRYARLPAGAYRFQVKACNGDGIWSATAAEIAFTVAPFFWQTWWFRLLAAGAALGTAFVVARQVVLRRLRRRLEALERQAVLDRERSRIARDMHDDLGSRLTHVALLVELAQRAPAEARERRMSQIASTVQRASESLDEIVWAVNPVNDVFPQFIQYVTQYAAEFLGAAGLRCRIDLPDQLPTHAVSPEIRHNLFLVVKEALNNIVRHADATEVRLCALATTAAFILTIEDDGRGFSELTASAGADGLRNMEERMREIAGDLAISSASGVGARITLTLPWSKPHLLSPKAAPVLL